MKHFTDFDPTDKDGNLLICQVHERNLMEKVSGLGDLGGTFIDIGANVGLWSLALCDEYAQVISFEPHPVAFASLKANALSKGDGHVVPIQIAAWKETAKLKLTCFAHSGHTTAKPGWKPGLEKIVGEQTGEIEVRAEALDSILKPRLEHPVAFVKIDTEGAEVEAIQGMKEILERDRPMLMIEIHKPGDEDKIVGLIPGRNWEVLTYGGSQYLFSRRGE